MKKQFLLFILSLLLLGTSSYTQSTRETLTNADIIELVKLGLGEALIIEKIRRSECQCDTSTDALVKLKSARVSDNIIMAMMNASSGTQTARVEQQTPASRPTANIGSGTVEVSGAGPDALRQITEPGIYLFENGKMQAIEATVFSGGKMNPLLSGITYGAVKSKWRARVRGASANLKTSNRQPVFYFVFNPDYRNSGATMAGLFWGMPATSPNEFMMVEMSVKKATREAVLGEYGVWTGASMGARDKDIREYSFEKIQTGIYKVMPKTDLAPGEYCFYYAGTVTGIGFAGGKVFDFSVTR